MSDLPPLWVTIGGKFNELVSAFNGAEKEITKFNQSAANKMTNFEAGMKKATAVGLAMSGMVIGLGAKSVKMAADFQSSQERLVTTAGESKSNLKMVSDGILNMAGQVGYSAQDLSKGMYTVESAGFHGAQGLDVLKASAEGAKEENASLSDVTNAVTTVLTDFRNQAGSAAQVTSGLITAVSLGKTTFQDLTGALHSVLPVASSARLTWQEMAADLSQMTVHGESAEQASQNMAHAIRSLMTPTQQQTKAMAEFGIQSHDVSSKLGGTGGRGLAGTVQYLSKTIIDQMGPAGEKLKTAFNQSTLAGQDAEKMFKALPADAQALAKSYANGTMTVGQYRSEIKKLPANEQALVTAWKAQQDASKGFANVLKSGSDSSKTYTSALGKMMGTTDGLNVALMLTGGNTKYVNDAIKQVTASSKGSKTEVKGFADTQETLNFQMDAAKAALGALAIKIGTALLPSVTSIVKKMAEFIGVLERHPKIVEAIGLAILGLTAALVAANAVMAITAMVSAGVLLPVLGIVAGVAALIAIIYELHKHWGGIWSAIKDATKTAWDAIKGAVEKGWDAVSSKVEKGLDAVGHFFKTGWDDASKATQKAWDAVKGYVSKAWDSVTGAVKKGADAVGGFIEKAWDGIKGTTERVWDAVHKFLSKWWPLLLVVFAPGIAAFVSLWNHLHTTVENTAKKVWNEIVAVIKKAWENLRSNFEWYGSLLSAAWHKIWDPLVTAIKSTWDKISKRVQDGVSAVEKYVKAGWDKVKSIFDAFTTAITNAWHKLWDPLVTFIKTTWDKIKKAVQDGVQGIATAVGAIGTTVLNAAKNGITSVFNAIKSQATQFTQVGSAIVQGIISGLSSGWSMLSSSVSNLANNALKAAKSALGINSPSRKFHDEVGKWIPAGIGEGIRTNAHLATQPLSELSGKLTAATSVSAAGYSGAAFAGGAGGVSSGVVRIEVPITSTIDGQVLATSIQTIALKYQQRNGRPMFSVVK